MKTLSKILKVATVLGFILLFCACSEEAGNTTTTSIIPVCSSDERDNSSALEVASSTSIKSLTANTVMRVWHYDTGYKLVCVVSGSASIVN